MSVGQGDGSKAKATAETDEQIHQASLQNAELLYSRIMTAFRESKIFEKPTNDDDNENN